MQALTTKKTQASGRTAAEQNREVLCCRAYELYEERGREGGHEVEDWLEAEAEITGKAERAAA